MPTGAAIVSLPARGVMRSHRRLMESVVEAVGAFAGDGAERREENSGLSPRVAIGNLRLVVGWCAPIIPGQCTEAGRSARGRDWSPGLLVLGIPAGAALWAMQRGPQEATDQ
jgi:hypothetical protein